MVKIWFFDFIEIFFDVLMVCKIELNRIRKCFYVGVVFDNVIVLYKNVMFFFEEINIDVRESVLNDRNDLKGNIWVRKIE